jgi:hypothetical protein
MPKLRHLVAVCVLALAGLPTATAQAHKIDLDSAADKVAEAAAAKHEDGRGFKVKCSRRIARTEPHSHRVRCTFTFKEGSGANAANCKGSGVAKFRSAASRRIKVGLSRKVGCVSANPPSI